MAEADEILIRIKADIKDLEKSMTKGTESIKDFGSKSEKSMISFKSITETALGFTFAGLMANAGDAVRQFALESVMNSMKLERAMNSLQIQTRGTADSLIKDLNAASKNTVSNLDLISNANKALALGISQNQLPELMEVATARAKLMGISVTQAFGDITLGIGRQSKMILDNLGIILDVEKAYRDYAVSIGKTADQLSDFEKKAAVTNSVIEESRALTLAMKYAEDDAMTSVEQLKKSYEELQITVGNFIVNGLKAVIEDYKLWKQEAGDVVLTDQARESLQRIGEAAIQSSKNLIAAKDAVTGLKNELAGLSDIKIKGQAEFDVGEQERLNTIDETKLQLLQEQNRLRDEGLKGSEYEGYLKRFITEKERELNEYQLTRKVEANNEFLLLQKQGKLKQEGLLNEEKTVKEVKTKVEENIKNLKAKLAEIALEQEIIKRLNETAKAREQETREITKQEIALRRMAVFEQVIRGSTPLGAFADIAGVIKKIDKFNLPGLTTPTSSPTPLVNPLTGTNVNVSIANITAANPQEAADTLGDMFANIFRSR